MPIPIMIGNVWKRVGGIILYYVVAPIVVAAAIVGLLYLGFGTHT